MKKLAIAFLGTVIALSAASAEEEISKLIQPKGSGLTVSKIQRDDGLLAEFNGQVWVTGTLIAEWLGGIGNIYEYVLIPDATSIKRLPYFTIKDPPHILSYQVRTIDIQNGPEALIMAVGSEKAERLINRHMKVLKVTGSFLLERYSVGVECDAPWARATIVKTKVPNPDNVARLEIPEGC